MSNLGINFKIPPKKVTISCCGVIGHISHISQQAEYRQKQNHAMKEFVKNKKRRTK